MELRPQFPEYIDGTMVCTFRECARKFYNSFILRCAESAISEHLHAGGAFAHALEATRNQLFNEGKSLDEALEVGFQALCTFWGNFEPPEGSNKRFDRVAAALPAYFEYFGIQTDPVQPYRYANGQAAIEMSFSIPLEIDHPVTQQPILYVGRYDMLGDYSGDIYVVDEKTSTSLGAQWGKKFDLRHQFMGYVWSAREHNINAVGAIARGIGFLKTEINFAESINTYSDEMLDRWYIQLLRDIARMKQLWQEGYWDYNFDEACNAYGGCIFKTPCRSPNPEHWLAEYEERTWNPLRKDPTLTGLKLATAKHGN